MTDYTDLVKMLRDQDIVCDEAADAIERLQAQSVKWESEAKLWAEATSQAVKGSLNVTKEIERLRAALRNLLAIAEDEGVVGDNTTLEAARAALAGEKSNG